MQIVWEFVVREDQIAEFAKFYSATGAWARLFHRSPDFLGTALLRDAQSPRRYLMVDRWDSAAAHQLMRARFAEEYAALGLNCEALTEAGGRLAFSKTTEIGFSTGRKCRRK